MTDSQSGVIKQLHRRVVLANVIGYAGMVGALLIYFSHGPVHPILYALTGVAVGSGTGVAYLSLLKIKRLRDVAGAPVPK